MPGFDIAIEVPSPGVQTIKEVNEQLTRTAKLQADIKRGAAAPIIKGPHQALERNLQAQASLGPGATHAQRQDAELAVLRAVKQVQRAQAATAQQGPASTAIKGPHQQRAAAIAAMHSAATQEEYQDAKIAADKADKAIARSQPKTPKTFGQKLSSVITSSRYDSSGNLMPLVGRTLELLGPAGPLVGGLGVLATALKAAADTISAVGSRALEFESNRLAAGGTVQEQATADLIGKSLNMSGKDITSLARQYSDRLNKDPMLASQTGDFTELGRLQQDRPVNQLAEVLRELEKLRTMPLGPATLEARAAGLDSLLPYRELSDGSRKMIADSIATHTAANTDTGYGANQKAAQAAVETGFGDMVDGIIKRATGSKTEIPVSDALKSYGTGFLHGLFPWLPAGSSEGAGPAGVSRSPGTVSPLDANTQALHEVGKATAENTVALDLHRKTISEGPLAAGAVPGAMRSLNPDAQKAYLQHIKTLGPFVN